MRLADIELIRTVFLFALLAMPTILARTSLSNRTRNLGALWNLNEMSECKLHYTALVYDNYGCWCGIGGAGSPMDGIDACCMAHDKCYDAALDNGICYDTYIEYADPYSWTCASAEPTCPDPDKQLGCKEALCECDKHVVDCWANFKKPMGREKCTHPVDRNPHSAGIIHRLTTLITSVAKFFIFFFPTN